MSFLRKLAWPATAALLFVLHLSAFVPWSPKFLPEEIEGSWITALNWAWSRGVDFGNDLVFTYGPWGFLVCGYDPSTFLLVVLGWVLFATAYFAALAAIACRLSPRIWVRAVWIGLMICAIRPAPEHENSQLLALCSSLLVLHFYVDDRPLTWIKILLAVALAFVSLGKFSLALAATGVVGAIGIDDLLRRRVPWSFAIHAAAIATLWLVAGQSFGSFVPWVRHSLDLAGGHAQAMSLDTATEGADVLLFAVCAVGLLALAAWWGVRNRAKVGRLRALLPVVTLAALVFLVFKAGFVRHDFHELISSTSLALLASMFAAAMWAGSTSTALRWAACAVAVACTALFWQRLDRLAQRSLPGDLWSAVESFPSRCAAALDWMSGGAEVRRAHLSHLQWVRETRSLPRVTGTVDFYPYDSRVVLAQGLDYRPRPVLQSYAAHTGTLERLNADFLRGPRAPESILWEILPIDSRFPSQDDAVSWPEILTRYDVKDASGSVVLLQRSPHPRNHTLRPLQEVPASLGTWIDVPPSAHPVWVRLAFRRKLLGRLVSSLYKPDEIHLEVRIADGSESAWRLVPEIAENGFLLSPLVVGHGTFALLGGNDWQTHLAPFAVVAIRVSVGTGGGTNAFYDDAFALTFSSLEFPHADVSAVPGIPETIRFLGLQRAPCDFSRSPPRTVVDERLRSVVLAVPTTRLVVAVPEDARTLRVRFGMLADSHDDVVKSDGAIFRVLAARAAADGSVTASVIWTRKLDPVSAAGDRGPQTDDIPLPAPPPPQVVLETLPGGTETGDSTYWADAEFRAR